MHIPHIQPRTYRTYDPTPNIVHTLDTSSHIPHIYHGTHRAYRPYKSTHTTTHTQHVPNRTNRINNNAHTAHANPRIQHIRTTHIPHITPHTQHRTYTPHIIALASHISSHIPGVMHRSLSHPQQPYMTTSIGLNQSATTFLAKYSINSSSVYCFIIATPLLLSSSRCVLYSTAWYTTIRAALTPRARPVRRIPILRSLDRRRKQIRTRGPSAPVPAPNAASSNRANFSQRQSRRVHRQVSTATPIPTANPTPSPPSTSCNSPPCAISIGVSLPMVAPVNLPPGHAASGVRDRGPAKTAADTGVGVRGYHATARFCVGHRYALPGMLVAVLRLFPVPLSPVTPPSEETRSAGR